jgi:hypothetical protein
MTELELVRAADVPRPEEVCRKFAWRGRPLLGLVLCGVFILPLSVWAGTIGLVAMLDAGAARFDETPFPLYWLLPSYAVGLACFGVPIIIYVRSAKRLRGKSLALLRDGVLVDVKVTQANRVAGRSPHTSARVELADGAEATLLVSGHPESLREGVINPGLVLAGDDYCLVFLDGKAALAKVQLRSRLRVASLRGRGL